MGGKKRTHEELRMESMEETRSTLRDDINEISSTTSNTIHKEIQENGMSYYITEKWKDIYPNKQVAVMTNLGKPPIPPDGYVPLRLGISCKDTSNSNSLNNERYTMDTLLWNSASLEGRLLELMKWTNRQRPTKKQTIQHINQLLQEKPKN